jgi:hypothetical protein
LRGVAFPDYSAEQIKLFLFFIPFAPVNAIVIAEPLNCYEPVPKIEPGLVKSFDQLRTNGLVPFVLSLSNHPTRNFGMASSKSYWQLALKEVSTITDVSEINPKLMSLNISDLTAARASRSYFKTLSKQMRMKASSTKAQ